MTELSLYYAKLFRCPEIGALLRRVAVRTGLGFLSGTE